MILSLPFTHIQPLRNIPRPTATFRPEHQHGRRDPEEEYDSFGHQTECGARGGAAREGVRGEVVCHQGVDGKGECEYCGDDCGVCVSISKV
jgi:hypothetical protein